MGSRESCADQYLHGKLFQRCFASKMAELFFGVPNGLVDEGLVVQRGLADYGAR